MNPRIAFLACALLLLCLQSVAATDCEDNSDCDPDETGYVCRAGDVYKYWQRYRCVDGRCQLGSREYDDEPRDICDPWDHEECVDGEKTCQPASFIPYETTTTSLTPPETTTSTYTTSTSTSTTSSTTTSSTTTSTLGMSTTTTLPAAKEVGFLTKIVYKRPIEVDFEYLKKIIDAILLWE